MAASDDFYNNIVSKIAPLFAQFGTTYTIRTPGTYDEDELETLPSTTRSVEGLIADQQIASTLGAIAFPVTQTSAGWIGKKNLILKSDTDPQAGEEILVDGQWFPLSKVNTIKPAEVVVLYILDVSR